MSNYKKYTNLDDIKIICPNCNFIAMAMDGSTYEKNKGKQASCLNCHSTFPLLATDKPYEKN